MANRLIEILAKRNMAQRELARLTGLDPIYINRIINEKIDVRVSTACKIAEALAMPIEQIFMPDSHPCPDKVKTK